MAATRQFAGLDHG